jgi:hypothetical protein
VGILRHCEQKKPWYLASQRHCIPRRHQCSVVFWPFPMIGISRPIIRFNRFDTFRWHPITNMQYFVKMMPQFHLSRKDF